MKHLIFTLFAAAAVAIFSGCASPTAEDTYAPRPPTREVLRAEAMFNNGQIRDAVFACVDIARKDPDTAGLAELQAKIQNYLAAHRTASFETVNATAHAVGMTNAKRYNRIPETFDQRKHVLGETESLASAPTPMQIALQTPVTMELEDADLAAIINEIGRSQNINIIADPNLTQNTLTVKIRDVPLAEFLEYIAKNMQVAFHVGSNMIWITAADPAAETGAPMETRVYKLRKGLGPMEMPPPKAVTVNSGGGGAGGGGGGAAIGGGQSQTQEPSVPMVIDALERFVPQPTGADMLWDDKTHALFIKNTRENLLLGEKIIDAMDVTPIQISIAARFMTVEQVDSRKLGIDWLLSNQRGMTAPARGSVAGGFWPPGGRSDLASGAMFSAMGGSGIDWAGQSILGRHAVQAVISALEESGKSQTLAQPRVTTLNNHGAVFFKGEEFRYYEDFDLQSYSSSAGGYGNGSSSSGTSLVPRGTPQTRMLGYGFTVTPSVGADLTSINLWLRPEISAFKKWEYYDLGGSGGNATTNGVAAGSGALKIPIFLNSYIETQVTVRSGETIILGGMIDTQQSVIKRGVPFFSKLPLIGGLFTSEEKENKPSNLLIFVTATLISETGEELVSINPQNLPGLPLPGDYYGAAENTDPEPAHENPAVERFIQAIRAAAQQQQNP